MKTKVLLIYPETPNTYWSFKYTNIFTGKKAAYPPLGLLTVAALLPDNYEPTLIDLNVEKLNDRDVIEADLVFVSAMIVQRRSFNEVVSTCNRLNKPVVAGGPLVTSNYKEIEGVDHLVLNEAEVTLPEFLSDYENGTAKEIYSDTTKPDITKTPIPRFDLIDVNIYNSVVLQYSRGCPFKCEFCDIIEMFGRKTRTKTPEQFVREMDALYEAGHRGSVFIVDDNFIGNKKNVKELLPKVIEWQKKNNHAFLFFTQASVNLAEDEDLMSLMRDAGFNMVFLGIETPVEETLLLTQKRQNTKTGLLESINRIQEKGMEVTGGFILGFDNDPENIQKAGIPTAMIGLLTALPMTQLYRRLDSEGRIMRNSSGNNTHDLMINFKPKMDIDKLVNGYKGVIGEIYKPRVYFERCLNLLKNLPHTQNSYGGINWPKFKMGFRAFFFSTVGQTFTRYGYRYWEFIIKSLIMRPALFNKAIKMAICGHHFFKITDEILAVDGFKKYLDRIIESLQFKKEKISINNIEESLKEILIFRDKILTGIQKKYQGFNEDLHCHLDESLGKLDENLKSYIDKVSSSIKFRIDKLSNEKIEGSRLELIKYRSRMAVLLKSRYSKMHHDIHKYTDELFKKYIKKIDNIILH
ncbi:B12-binding domain-containing radical SAM protein [Spirochaetota bacterium]